MGKQELAERPLDGGFFGLHRLAQGHREFCDDQLRQILGWGPSSAAVIARRIYAECGSEFRQADGDCLVAGQPVSRLRNEGAFGRFLDLGAAFPGVAVTPAASFIRLRLGGDRLAPRYAKLILSPCLEDLPELLRRLAPLLAQCPQAHSMKLVNHTSLHWGAKVFVYFQRFLDGCRFARRVHEAIRFARVVGAPFTWSPWDDRFLSIAVEGWPDAGGKGRAWGARVADAIARSLAPPTEAVTERVARTKSRLLEEFHVHPEYWLPAPLARELALVSGVRDGAPLQAPCRCGGRTLLSGREGGWLSYACPDCDAATTARWDARKAAPPRRNTHPSFVGVEGIKRKQHSQLLRFRASAEANQWMGIHEDHYDWWMFPIDEKSGYGLAWTVYEGDIQELKADRQYLDRYLEGVRLLALSWGWDLDKHRPIQSPHADQRWQHWPIRLYKCAKSLKLFGFTREFDSMREYAQGLMARGERMRYGRDLGWLFQ